MNMWNKILLASITLDKKRLKRNIGGSCDIECIPTVKKWLTETEREELRNCLNRATEILRKSYTRSREEIIRK